MSIYSPPLPSRFPEGEAVQAALVEVQWTVSRQSTVPRLGEEGHEQGTLSERQMVGRAPDDMWGILHQGEGARGVREES